VKKETVVNMLTELKKVVENESEFNSALTKAFGEDSIVTTNLTSVYAEAVLEILANELSQDAKNIRIIRDGLEWLFWESMVFNDEPSKFYIEDKEYLGIPENVFILLDGQDRD
jgi:hypothetical protein